MDINQIDRRLRRQLDEVAARYRRLRAAAQLSALWILLAVLAAVLLGLNRQAGFYLAGETTIFIVLGAVTTLIVLLLAWRSARDPRWVARRIERQFPQLEARLLTAIEQQPATRNGQYDFLQYQVIQEALFHGYRHDWRKTLPPARYAMIHLVCLGALATYIVAALGLYQLIEPKPFRWAPILGLRDDAQPLSATKLVSVDPGDTSVEQGTSLLILAEFEGRLPFDCLLEVTDPATATTRRMAMKQSLEDPVFGARIESLDAPRAYRVIHDGRRSQDYQVDVFRYPALERADARLEFPDYTGLDSKSVEDVRHVTAVEGTSVTLICHLNQPHVSATLTAEDGTSLEMDHQADDAATRTATMTLTQSQRWTLQLEDSAGRTNKQPPEFLMTVVPNRPATLEMAFPSRDVQVSPLEELQLTARMADDYGLHRYGLSYQMAGDELEEVVLGQSARVADKMAVDHLLAFEQLEAEPNQLLSYYFWAEDIAADGQTRRTLSDMYFAEVRPFDEVYRQGEQPPGGSQGSQQPPNSGQNAGQRAGNQVDQLAQQQKEIITATWNVLRREKPQELSAPFQEDVAVIRDSQVTVADQVTELAEQIRDATARTFVEQLDDHLKEAVTELTRAADQSAWAPLESALKAEQAAYQSLLNLRAREHEVRRESRQNAQQARSAGAQNPNSRSQRQLQQLALSNDQNRYETQRQATQRQQQREAAQQESRQILNRLKELARRLDPVRPVAERHAVEVLLKELLTFLRCVSNMF